MIYSISIYFLFYFTFILAFIFDTEKLVKSESDNQFLEIHFSTYIVRYLLSNGYITILLYYWLEMIKSLIKWWIKLYFYWLQYNKNDAYPSSNQWIEFIYL